METLDAFSKDLLRETANIMAQKTAHPIETILRQKTVISKPEIMMQKMEFVADSLGQADEVRDSVFIRILGDGKGAAVLLIKPEDSQKLLLDVDKAMRMDALREIANIVAGACLGGIARLLSLKLMQSVPVATSDMSRAIVNEIVSEVGLTNADLLCALINVAIGPENIPLSMVFIFDTDTTNLIISKSKDMTNQ